MIPFKIIARDDVPFAIRLNGVEELAPLVSAAQTAADEAQAASAMLSPVIYGTFGKNKFDDARVVEEWEINPTTGLAFAFPGINSEISGLVEVPEGAAFINVSGLPVNSAGGSNFDRYHAFYAADGETPVGFSTAYSFTAYNATTIALAVPPGAVWFRIELSKRNGTGLDYSGVQIEAGGVATGYEPFVANTTLAFGGKLLVAKDPNGGNANAPAFAGGDAFGLGDSITETTNVDGGLHVYPSGFRANWPDYAIPTIAPEAYYSFAKAGAHFISETGLTTNQRFENQITAAVALAASENIQPRWLIVSLGTNDWNSAETAFGGGIGNYATAMGKSLSFDGSGVPTTTLDKTVSMEAARLGFARLRFHFPNTVMFYATPLQRADYSADEMLTTVDAFGQMARAYGFEVIDCYGESGVLHEFEVIGGAGRDLSDGLHPDASGQLKQGKLIAARIMSRLSS